jgi:hypothetical protein
MDANENSDDWAERIGKRVSTIFLACLAALFIYGFVVPLFTG